MTASAAASSSSAAPSTPSKAAAAPVQSTLAYLDDNKNGKVSKSEYLDLDENKDGKVTKKEAEDINNDGKVTKKEKELLDTNDDGKVNRHEILKAPEADINKDGVVTKQELHKVETLLPPPPPAWLHAPPPPRPPPRTTWPVMGKWNSVEEAIDEVVLLTLCIVTFTQAVRWLYRRLSGAKKGKYKKVGKLDASDYGPDPGLELAKDGSELEPVSQPLSVPTNGAPANAAESKILYKEAEAMFAEPGSESAA